MNMANLKNHSAPVSIVWLRRDLRLYDHTALAEALARPEPVLPIFVLDTDILAQFPNPKDRRLSFIAAAVCRIHRELHAIRPDSGLLVLHGSVKEILSKLADAVNAARVSCGVDYEPAAIMRDRSVRDALEKQGREFIGRCDHLLVPANAITKEDGTPYRVFTPFSKVWRARLSAEALAERKVKLSSERLSPLPELSGFTVIDAGKGEAHMLKAIGYEYAEDPLWPVDGGMKRLKPFISKTVSRYGDTRDFMALEGGTSQISPYLRFGLISIREAARLAVEREHHEKWLGELAWRDFYAMILFRYPASVTEEFQEKYRGLNWSENETLWKAFMESRTGFPIIDAAMRQLHQDGWMHNRARMIVASFLTKDLLIDWRWGERHFAQWLMDYDMASNVGGWQWAASTGTDAQPYFRIFNPTSQSQRFDAKGEYIRHYMPELAKLSDKDIHAPPPLLRPKDYPGPVVDHSKSREMALQMFKNA